MMTILIKFGASFVYLDDRILVSESKKMRCWAPVLDDEGWGGISK